MRETNKELQAFKIYEILVDQVVSDLKDYLDLSYDKNYYFHAYINSSDPKYNFRQESNDKCVLVLYNRSGSGYANINLNIRDHHKDPNLKFLNLTTDPFKYPNRLNNEIYESYFVLNYIMYTNNKNDKAVLSMTKISHILLENERKQLRIDFNGETDRTELPTKVKVFITNSDIRNVDTSDKLKSKPFGHAETYMLINEVDCKTKETLSKKFKPIVVSDFSISKRIKEWIMENDIKIDFYGNILYDEDLLAFKMKFGDVI